MRHLFIFAISLLALVALGACGQCGTKTLPVVQHYAGDYAIAFNGAGATHGKVSARGAYFDGSTSVSVALEFKGVPLRTLEVEPGGARFFALAVGPSSVRWIALSCEAAHEAGIFPEMACTATKAAPTGHRVLVEVDRGTGTVKANDGECPVDDNGTKCCPDVVTGGAVCPG
jgi:hypothetical protein